MIGYFPYPYPDELCYSWFARFAIRSGFSGRVNVSETLFDKREAKTNIMFVKSLNDETRKVIKRFCSMKDLILFHTMFPHYSRYITSQQKQDALNHLMSGQKRYRSILPISTAQKANTVSYCPLCAAEDYEAYGEAYFHCVHQISEMSVCPFHFCRLIEIDLPDTRQFISLEQIRTEKKTEIVTDGLVLEFTERISKMFFQPVELEKTVDVSGIFKNKLRQSKEFRSKAGVVFKIDKLYKACLEVVGVSEIRKILPEHGRFRFIISGRYKNPSEVCLAEMLIDRVIQDSR